MSPQAPLVPQSAAKAVPGSRASARHSTSRMDNSRDVLRFMGFASFFKNFRQTYGAAQCDRPRKSCRKRKNGAEHANITQHRLKNQSETIRTPTLENGPANGYNKAVAREIHSVVTECECLTERLVTGT